MNANTWTRNQSTLTNFTQPVVYNNFGGTVGGPVWAPGMNPKLRQKFFFFVALDYIRYRFLDYNTARRADRPLSRQGNFSELLGSNPFYSGSHVIYDPNSCPTSGAATCTPFAGNIIPANRQSHNGMAIMNAYPLPVPGFQVGTTNWIAQASHPINQRKGTEDFDIILNAKNKISARPHRCVFRISARPGSGLTGKYFNRPNQTNAVSLISTISPTMVNEARITYSLDDVYIPVNTALNGFNRQVFGNRYPLPDSQRQRRTEQDPHRHHSQFLQSRRRPLSVSLFRPHLDGRRYPDQSHRKPYLEIWLQRRVFR